MKTIVVSAVGLRKGGTLRILQQTLEYLSGRVAGGPDAGGEANERVLCGPDAGGEALHVIALVHDRSLCSYPGIEYIEIPWATKSWLHRLWCEYVTMHRISKRLAAENGGEPVDLWLSLHDTTPRVVCKRQEVYCHTSFPWLKLRLRDFVMDPKIPAFKLLTPIYYRIGARKNSSIIVQQDWLADALSRLMRVPRERFRVIPPVTGAPAPHFAPKSGENPETGAKVVYFAPDDAGQLAGLMRDSGCHTFLYVSTPDCHKNFETLLEAARLLCFGKCPKQKPKIAKNPRVLRELPEAEEDFRVTITVGGDENRYARWLHRKWGSLPNVDFHGRMGREELERHYRESDCLVFPSRVETWGLPISEYKAAHPGGMLILADLPYARGHEKCEDRPEGHEKHAVGYENRPEGHEKE